MKACVPMVSRLLPKSQRGCPKQRRCCGLHQFAWNRDWQWKWSSTSLSHHSNVWSRYV